MTRIAGGQRPAGRVSAAGAAAAGPGWARPPGTIAATPANAEERDEQRRDEHGRAAVGVERRRRRGSAPRAPGVRPDDEPGRRAGPARATARTARAGWRRRRRPPRPPAGSATRSGRRARAVAGRASSPRTWRVPSSIAPSRKIGDEPDARRLDQPRQPDDRDRGEGQVAPAAGRAVLAAPRDRGAALAHARPPACRRPTPAGPPATGC